MYRLLYARTNFPDPFGACLYSTCHVLCVQVSSVRAHGGFYVAVVPSLDEAEPSSPPLTPTPTPFAVKGPSDGRAHRGGGDDELRDGCGGVPGPDDTCGGRGSGSGGGSRGGGSVEEEAAVALARLTAALQWDNAWGPRKSEGVPGPFPPLGKEAEAQAGAPGGRGILFPSAGAGFRAGAQAPVSRAFFKLREAACRTRVFERAAAAPAASKGLSGGAATLEGAAAMGVAIDVGAAPGGWSQVRKATT